MTNAEKYSPAYGFDRGTLFEATRKDGGGTIIGYFQGIDEKGRTYPRIDYQYSLPMIGAVYHFRIDDIKSIRILSGQYSVWQFAPSDAIYAIIWDFYDIDFEDQNGFEYVVEAMKAEYGDEYDTEAPKFTLLNAPWWWLEAQK